MLSSFLTQTIADIELPGFSGSYSGKVRRSYDTSNNRKIIIATDRLSAFDRQITTIPLKGQVLTQLSRFWFDGTSDICPNHILAYPDPNVTVCRKLSMLPVELVVRGYLAGSTATSILKMYKAGKREMYGIQFKEGMKDNEELDRPIITPTTKAASTDHDEPLTAQIILGKAIVEKDIWEKASSYALALFARGQAIAKKHGLILADTKYEFGMDANGTLTLGDEIHTPDSSRYWIAENYSERMKNGFAPEALDKDVVRRFISSQCDPYKDPIPFIPDEIRLATSEAYISVFEKITHTPFVFPDPAKDPVERIISAVNAYMKQP